MNEDIYSDFVDQIYDTAFEPDLWIPVMERFADMLGGTGSWLSELNMIDGTGGGVLARIDPGMRTVYTEYFAMRNPLSNVDNPGEYLRTWVPRIITDEDWMPKEDLLKSEYYNDFLAPQNIHSTLMIRLARNTPDVSALSVNRPKDRPQFGAAEIELARRLHPHLMRAYNVGYRFAGLRHANQDLMIAMDHSMHGIILLEGDGRIRYINRAAQALVANADGLRVAAGRLTAVHPDAGRRLAALIASAAPASRTLGRGGSMPLPSSSRRLPLSLTVAPARSERVDVFDRGPSVIVCITDLEAGVSLPEHKLRELFGLTPAETRVSLALFEGCTPQEAADSLGISFHTVRVHLGRIFEKTGTHRQTELVRLMMRTVGAFREQEQPG